MEKRIFVFMDKYDRKEITREDNMIRSLESWIGYSKQANAHNLTMKMLKGFAGSPPLAAP
ncbi:MAG: hypothetical protein HY518_01550 [Candidatus Aenigmarchaeota archaeon]|nr:hypothetical protein [Candidatus Aenigmarchaeota archaeon]